MNISKRLLWLNGIAIIAVVLHHSAAFSLQAMFLWTDRYLDVSTPNYDQLGSPAYLIIMTFRLLLTFAGPAFFFISGYFIGISEKTSQSKANWQMLFARIKLLLIPFIIWTALRYILLRQIPTSLDAILTPYHWIPLLIQFYLISPLMVFVAKRNWRLLLITAAIAGWSMTALAYMGLFVSDSARDFQALIPNWIFLFNLPFWFPFGVVAGLYFMELKSAIVSYRWQLLFLTVFFAGLVLTEYVIVDRLVGPQWLGPGFGGFTKLPYSLLFLLTFIAFDKSAMPLARNIAQIGTQSLGIYLGNIPSVYVAAVLMYRFTPNLLGYHLVYFSILAVVGLGVPLLLMSLVRRSIFRHKYRLLFG